MAGEASVGADGQLTAADDFVHESTADSWETETYWFGFFAPDQSLTGYLYGVVRPNLGVCSGGAMLWDDTAYLPWEIRHFDYQWHLPITLAPGDSFAQLPTGIDIEVLEPLSRYAIRYSSGQVSADLTFTGIGPPYTPQVGDPPFAAARHLDQPGRIVGTVTHEAGRMDIDCLAMRDRSWGPRDDRRPGRFGYTFGLVSEDHAFLSYSKPRGSSDQIFAGFYQRDGVRARLVDGHRSVDRDPATGAPTQVRIDATDDLDRVFTATGEWINRLCFTPYPRMVNWTTTLSWGIEGDSGIGEDQDVWPIERWSSYRRLHQARDAGAGP